MLAVLLLLSLHFLNTPSSGVHVGPHTRNDLSADITHLGIPLSLHLSHLMVLGVCKKPWGAICAKHRLATKTLHVGPIPTFNRQLESVTWLLGKVRPVSFRAALAAGRHHIIFCPKVCFQGPMPPLSCDMKPLAENLHLGMSSSASQDHIT